MTARICECKEDKILPYSYPHKVGCLKKVVHFGGNVKDNVHIVVGTYDGYVSLSNPSQTWSHKSSFENVPYLPKGTCVEYVSDV